MLLYALKLFKTFKLKICFPFQSSLVRLGNLRLAVSHTFLYKKMDEYGDNHLEKITSSVKEESDRLAKAKSDIPSSESANKHVSKLTVEVQAPKEIMFTNKAAEGKESTIAVSSEYQSLSADIGRKLIIGNINYSSEPHEITEDHRIKLKIGWELWSLQTGYLGII